MSVLPSCSPTHVHALSDSTQVAGIACFASRTAISIYLPSIWRGRIGAAPTRGACKREIIPVRRSFATVSPGRRGGTVLCEMSYLDVSPPVLQVLCDETTVAVMGLRFAA